MRSTFDFVTEMADQFCLQHNPSLDERGAYEKGVIDASLENLKMVSDLYSLAYAVAALNPAAEEIGPGKLSQIVADAREALGWEDEQ